MISGPSGVGKGTVVKALRALRPDLAYSISDTTRPPRPGELDGVDYRFLDRATFEEHIQAGALLEFVEVFGHLYGTPAEPVAEAVAAGLDIILEIDIRGASTVRHRVPDAVLVFLAPPSEEELVRRLQGRRTESDHELGLRLARVREEMAARSWFDHEVVNDDVERAAAEVAAIIDVTRAID